MNLDAEIAKVIFHQDVLGVVPCCRYDGNWMAFDGGETYTHPRPIYVAHCTCDDDFTHKPRTKHFDHYWTCFEVVPEYSTDIAHAWEVVTALIGKGLTVSVNGSNQWYNVMVSKDGRIASNRVRESVPLAICLAALGAVNVIDKECDNEP